MGYISKIKNGTFLAAISLMAFASCKPSPVISTYFTSDDNGGYASDASKIELVNEDAISIADAAGTTYSNSYIAGCSSVSTDTISVPHTLIIRFGDTNCPSLDGKQRRGAIIVSYSGRYTDSEQIHTITFDNYYINNNQLTGSIKVARVDTTVTGNWYYRVKVAETLNLNQNTPSSQVINWDGALVRKWVSGYGTDTRADDIFSISGNANLVRNNGTNFQFGIATPLQVALGCEYIESGVVDVTGPNGARILDYGSGSCDAKAQVTLGQDNTVHPITLLP